MTRIVMLVGLVLGTVTIALVPSKRIQASGNVCHRGQFVYYDCLSDVPGGHAMSIGLGRTVEGSDRQYHDNTWGDLVWRHVHRQCDCLKTWCYLLGY